MFSASLLHSPTPDQRRRIVATASLVSAVIGAAVLFGWAFGIEALKSVFPGAAQMKPNTAVGLVLAGCAVALPPRTRGPRRWLSPALGLLLALLGVATLAEYMTGADLGIDQWLFTDPTLAFDTPPGRMSPFAAWAFVLVGGCLILQRNRALGWLSGVCALQVIAIALLSLLGYVWSVPDLVTTTWVPPLAVHTACAFLLLGWAIFLRVPRRQAGVRGQRSATAERSLRLSFWALVAALLAFAAYTYRANVAFVEAAQAVTDTQLLRLEVSKLGLCLEHQRAARARHRARPADDTEAELADLNRECGRLLRGLAPRLQAQPRLAGEFAPLRQAIAQRLGAQAPPPAGGARDAQPLGPALAAFQTAVALQEQEYDAARRAHRSSMLVSLIVTLLGCITIFAAVTRAMVRNVRENARAREETEHQKLLLSKVINSIPDPVAYRAAAGMYLGANEAYGEMVGRPAEQLVGRGLAEVFGPGASLFQARDQRVLERAEHRRDEDWITYPDGSRRLMEVARSPLRARDGRTLGVLTVARDIMERKAAEEALERARALAEESARLKTAFLANMSHEIRTPMTAVLGLADLLAADDLSGPQRQRVEAMRASGRHLLNIINDILDFSRLEAGKLTMESVDLSMAQLLQEVQSLLHPLAAERGIAFDVGLGPGVPEYVQGDPTRLRQVLLNLAGNAIKFTPRGSVRLQVEARPGSGPDAHLAFVMRDTGIGIPPEKLAMLFSPFTQADQGTARQYGGSGLGLAISKRLAEAMGGRLEADSTVGVGSVFRFEVALRPGHPPATPAPQSAFLPAARPQRILAAEDVAVNRDILQAALTRQGHHVEFAFNGAEALERVQAGDFDLVLMDVQMPVLDGVEATRRIRGLPTPVRDIPIVGLTANVLAMEQEGCLAAGMNECLNKPLDWQLLAAAIARHGNGNGNGNGNGETGAAVPALAAPQPAAARDANVLDAAQIDSLRAVVDTADLVPLLTGAFATVAALGVALAGDLPLPDVQAHAHSMKGTAGSFGMAAIQATAAEIEAAAAAGARAAVAIARLQQDIAATREALRARALLELAAPAPARALPSGAADDEAPFEGRHDPRDTQALLRIAAHMGRLGAWSVELDRMQVHWSDEVREIHQVPRGFTCTVDQSLAFYAPASRPVVAEAFRKCAAEGLPFDLEGQLVTARGEMLWVRAIGAAERNPAGRIVRVRGAFQDITRAKREAERSRELAERLTMTLESLTDGFFTLDRGWTFTYVNPPGARMLQRSREELVGRKFWEMFPRPAAGKFHGEYERAMQTNKPVEFEAYYEPLSIWVQVRAFPSPQGLAVSFRDITAQLEAQQEVLRLTVELEERVRERTADLEAATRDLEAVAFAVAHDLRAPLAAVCVFADMIAETEGEAMSPRGLHYLSRVVAAGRQMDLMTDGLLGLARLSSAPLEPEPVDLAEIARGVGTLLQDTSGGRPVEFILPPSLPAFGDKVLLTQVMQNLLSNAWKFSSRSEHPRVELSTVVAPDGGLAYCVSDNGVGFDMQYAARLFGAFERLHSQDEFPGTGIGLALVRKIVERHKGRVWAESSPGCGARIYFTIPPR